MHSRSQQQLSAFGGLELELELELAIVILPRQFLKLLRSHWGPQDIVQCGVAMGLSLRVFQVLTSHSLTLCLFSACAPGHDACVQFVFCKFASSEAVDICGWSRMRKNAETWCQETLCSWTWDKAKRKESLLGSRKPSVCKSRTFWLQLVFLMCKTYQCLWRLTHARVCTERCATDCLGRSFTARTSAQLQLKKGYFGFTWQVDKRGLTDWQTWLIAFTSKPSLKDRERSACPFATGTCSVAPSAEPNHKGLLVAVVSTEAMPQIDRACLATERRSVWGGQGLWRKKSEVQTPDAWPAQPTQHAGPLGLARDEMKRIQAMECNGYKWQESAKKKK